MLCAYSASNWFPRLCSVSQIMNHKLCVCIIYLRYLSAKQLQFNLDDTLHDLNENKKRPSDQMLLNYKQAVAENSHTFSSAVNKILARSFEGSDLLQLK